MPALYAQIRQFTHIDPAHAGEGMLHGGSKAEPSDAVDEIEINCMEEQQRNMIAGSPLHELVSEQLVVVKVGVEFCVVLLCLLFIILSVLLHDIAHTLSLSIGMLHCVVFCMHAYTHTCSLKLSRY